MKSKQNYQKLKQRLLALEINSVFSLKNPPHLRVGFFSKNWPSEFLIMIKTYLSFCCFVRDIRAVTAIEYALIAGGIALAISLVVFTLGDETSAVFQEVESGFDGP